MEKRLPEFVHHAREKGMNYGTIRLLLLSAGWRERDIARALAAEGLDLPVPEPAGVGTAREVFLYLLTFTALYVMVVGLVVLFFNYFDLLLPDPAWEKWQFSEESTRSTIRWSLAAVIVACPLFFLLTRSIASDMRRHPEKIRSQVRRWLIYLTLFAASVTLMFDVISLLYYFLEGELSTRIVLKILALCVIVGTVSGYYMVSLRGLDEATA